MGRPRLHPWQPLKFPRGILSFSEYIFKNKKEFQERPTQLSLPLVARGASISPPGRPARRTPDHRFDTWRLEKSDHAWTLKMKITR